MQALSFFLDDELFAVDVIYVEKFVRNIPVTPVVATPDPVIGIANMKGRVITVLSLSTLLKRDAGKAETRSPVSGANAVVFKSLADGDQIALQIDRPGGLLSISDCQQLPPPVAAGPAEKHIITGIAEADGLLYRIIDASALINQDYTADPIIQREINDEKSI